MKAYASHTVGSKVGIMIGFDNRDRRDLAQLASILTAIASYAPEGEHRDTIEADLAGIHSRMARLPQDEPTDTPGQEPKP